MRVMGLTSEQEAARSAFREFVEREIVEQADVFDREEKMPVALIRKLANEGYLGAMLSKAWGGGGMDIVTYGLLNEEIGRGCSSVRSLITVHNMVCQVISRWGTSRQQEHWLPGLACGQKIAAFGLSEPNVGSDARQVETLATLAGDSYVLNGEKKWITFGEVANLFLIFARSADGPCAFLVTRETPGLSTKLMTGLLGVRASMLAEVHLDECRISKENLIGGVGFGSSHVAAAALNHGRYSVAWGCVGIARACLEACLRYTSERKQFGSLLKDHQLIRRMISNMVTNLKAARLLCLEAGYLMDAKDPGAVAETFIAKYFASGAAAGTARDAVQIHGANGCSSDYRVGRYFRDAKIMEIIEGSDEIQQLTIAEHAYCGF